MNREKRRLIANLARAERAYAELAAGDGPISLTQYNEARQCAGLPALPATAAELVLAGQAGAQAQGPAQNAAGGAQTESPLI